MTPNQERYRGVYLQGGVIVFVHERFEQANNHFRGTTQLWKQVAAVVDNGRGLHKAEYVRLRGATVLVDTEISQTAFEALLKATP